MAGCRVIFMFLDFSSALAAGGVDEAGAGGSLLGRLLSTIFRADYNLYVCVSEHVLSSTGAPQGTVLSPFLFSLYTSDFEYNSEACHLQKYCDDTAVVACIRDGQEREYKGPVGDCVG